MYVYERDWMEYESGRKRAPQKRTELDVIETRRSGYSRATQRQTETRKSGQRRVDSERTIQQKTGQSTGEYRRTATDRNRNGQVKQVESERARREKQLQQRKLREKKLREQERRRKRRARRRMMLIEICLLAAVIVLFVGRDTWTGRLRQWINTTRTGMIQEVSSVPVSSLDSEVYPESLRELLEKNPEAEQFVLDYPKNKDKHPDINLSGEVTEGEIPLFIQWDERWGYETYGGDFIAVTGCGPTCLSMVYCGLRGDTTQNPLQVAQWAEQKGYYVEGAGSSWDLMSYGAQDLGLTQVNVIFDAEHILSTLRSGSPIICAMRPGDFTTAGHFIVLSGVDEDGKIIVRDPNSRINSDKSWAVEDLMPQIKNLWGYQ